MEGDCVDLDTNHLVKLAMSKTLKIIPGFIMATLGLFAGVGPNARPDSTKNWKREYRGDGTPNGG